MAATTKLIIYNAALREIAAASLADTTTANTRLYELDGAWDHAIEYIMSLRDWGFSRRRAVLTSVADASFSPYTRRMTKPADYLRKCWLRTAADDDYQVDHAEIAAAFYTIESTALLEYVSDHADNYNPANWPPHFTRILTLHLAALVAPRLARAGADDLGRLNGQLQTALSEAEGAENVFLTNTNIASVRHPVMRRAIEFMGQQLAGTVSIHSHNDRLRWHMNRSWSHVVKYVLELGAWNFATSRAKLSGGIAADTVVPSEDGGTIEGYSLAPTSADTDATPLTEFTYGFSLPSDFLHKVWLKRDPVSPLEVPHQFIGSYVFADEDPIVMEYIAHNDYTTNPANWSANFTDAVAAHLALSVAPEFIAEADGRGVKVSASDVRTKLQALWELKLSDAKLRDAIQQYPKYMPSGRFVTARSGGTRSLIRSN